MTSWKEAAEELMALEERFLEAQSQLDRHEGADDEFALAAAAEFETVRRRMRGLKAIVAEETSSA